MRPLTTRLILPAHFRAPESSDELLRSEWPASDELAVELRESPSPATRRKKVRVVPCDEVGEGVPDERVGMRVTRCLNAAASFLRCCEAELSLCSFADEKRLARDPFVRRLSLDGVARSRFRSECMWLSVLARGRDGCCC